MGYLVGLRWELPACFPMTAGAMSFEIEANAWTLALLGAFLAGLGKGGVPGVGNLTVALFALAFPPRESVGILLPVLIAADLVAITVYRRHCEWRFLGRLLPWMLAGIVVGYLALHGIDNTRMRPLIGTILLGMTVLHFWRQWRLRQPGGERLAEVPHRLGFRAASGVLGGFATMVANAAGPVAAVYFLAVGLPKMAFIGTGAWCFFTVNLVKVPFMADLGMLSFRSLDLSLVLAPAAVLGALAGPFLVRWINQRVFESLVWVFVVLAGFRLLY